MKCESCNGSGQPLPNGIACFLCNGSGHICDRCGEAAEDSGGLCMDCINEDLDGGE